MATAQAEPATSPVNPYLDPPKQCDLVMKGGVTSGVVYPPALCALARQYRFRDIGGTSAGAIAAAGAAAAEFGRESGGFEKLKKLSGWIGRDRNLLNLFQPSERTRPLFDLALDAMEASRAAKLGPRDLWRIARFRVPLQPERQQMDAAIGAGIGAGIGLLLLGLLAIVYAIAGGSNWSTLVVAAVIALVVSLAVAGALLGWLASGIYRRARALLAIVLTAIPANYLGLCRGRSDRPGSPAVLTDWLSDAINDLAGRAKNDPPLTFGDLQAKGPVNGDPAAITLRMFTTNLSQSQPYILPFDRTQFIFKRSEMRDFFPENVVDHLWEKGATRPYLPADFRYLPTGGDLPVVVAARMSLSFPVLISAVPLYTVKFTARKTYNERQKQGISYVYDPEKDLQREWFSDGGISSNFPVHFFDDWLPTRPTFGIALSSMPADDSRNEAERFITVPVDLDLNNDAEVAQLEAESLRRAIYLPKANRPLAPGWRPIDGVAELLHAMWSAAQNYRDATQSRLPSYRDRIVHIRLTDDEGGLNLAMDPETIKRMTDKGTEAGNVLITEFNFDHHRWVRFQVLMAQLESELPDLLSDYDEIDYERLIVAAGAATDGPYRRDQPWCEDAIRRLAAIRELLARWETLHQEFRAANAEWQSTDFFRKDAPRPEPVLRVTPNL